MLTPNETVLYEGASANGMLQTIKNGFRPYVHQVHIQLKGQPDSSIIPETPLDLKNEFGKGITTDEAQNLAQSWSLSPLQQVLMSQHHRPCYLPFHLIFELIE